jgi:hypothetical protein
MGRRNKALNRRDRRAPPENAEKAFLCDLWNFFAISAVKSLWFSALKTALNPAVYRAGSELEKAAFL